MRADDAARARDSRGASRRYAELAVRVGANVQPGQDVVVTCLVEHAEIARAVAREAYRAGATHVDRPLLRTSTSRRAAIELGPEEELGWSPPYMLDWVRRWDEERPALIPLTGQPRPRPARRPRPRARRQVRPARHPRSRTLEHIGARRVQLDDRRRAERRAGRRRSSASRTSSACGTPSRTATRLDEPDPVARLAEHVARAPGARGRR